MAGLETHVYRFVPGGSTRTLLLLHGTGGDEQDLLPLGRLLDPEAALLSPRGNVLEAGAPRFFRRLAEGVFDAADLARRTAELLEWLDAAVARHALDRTHIVAVGYSNGANVAAAALLTRAHAFPEAVLLRAMLPFEPAQPPALDGDAVLIASGRADPIVPAVSAERLAALLRAAGADVTHHWSDAGHPLAPADVAAAKRWLAHRSRSR